MGDLSRALGKGISAAAGAGAAQFAEVNKDKLEEVRLQRLQTMGIAAEEGKYQRDQERKVAEMSDPNSAWSMAQGAELQMYKDKEASKARTTGKPKYETRMDPVTGNEQLVQIIDGKWYPVEEGGVPGASVPGATTTGDATLDDLKATRGGTAKPKSDGGEEKSNEPGLLKQAWSGAKDLFTSDDGTEGETSPEKQTTKTGRSGRANVKGESLSETRKDFDREMVGSESKSVEQLEALYKKYEGKILEPDRLRLQNLIKRKKGQKVGSGRSAR